MNNAGDKGIDDDCSTGVSLNALATPTIVCDNEFHIRSINTAAVEAWGFDPQNMLGRSIEIILAKTTDQARFDAATWPDLKSPQQFERSDGSIFWGMKSTTQIDTNWVVQIFEVDALVKERDAFAHSNDIWSKAVEAAEHGIWIFDTAEEKHFYSEGWKRMRGFPANEAVNETDEDWLARVHPDDRAKVRSYIKEHASGNPDLLAFEYREKRLDGRWIWISSRGRAVFKGKNNEAVQYSGTDTDITKFKEVEKTVEVLTRRHELALQTSGVGVWEINLITGGFKCDQALAEMYGFPIHGDKEVPLDIWKNGLHPDDAEDAQLKAFMAMESKTRLENAFRIVKPDGTVRHIKTTCNYHVDSNGEPKFLGADRDVTEDWEREQEIRKQSAQFEGAMENMQHGLAMFDSDNRLVVANQLYADMYSLPSDRVKQGIHLLEIVNFAIEKGVFKNPAILPTAHKIFKSIPISKNQDLIWRLADGRIINFTISPLENGGWISIHKDITEQHRAKKRLAESEQRFRDFTNSASDWCWESDKGHRLTYVTDSFETSTGLKTVDFVGQIIFDVPTHEEDMPGWKALFEPSDGENRKPFKDFPIRMPQPDGDVFHFTISGTPRYDRNGKFIGFRGTGCNVTAEETRKKQLAHAEKLLKIRSEQLVEAQILGKIGDWSYKLGDDKVWWAPEIYTLLGHDPETFQPHYAAVMALYCNDDAALVLESQAEILRTGGIRSVDVSAQRADGSLGDFVVTSKTLTDENGDTIGVFGTIQDISERKQAEQQLKKLAYYDPLTGLANRVLFHRELDAVLKANKKTPAHGALLLLDLDRFKEVNDSLGHATGDELLGKVSRLLARTVNDNHFLARLGGDEFAVVVPQSDGRQEIVELAYRVNTALSGSFKLERGDVIVGTSIGIAMIPQDGSNCTDLLRNADLALYEAKENGRGCFEFFHMGLKDSAQHKIALAHDLRIAITKNKGLSVHYQPQIDLTTGRVCGYEALMRWNHPELGMVSPAEFIPIAETSHLICDLGVWILQEATRQAKAWIDAGEPRRKISVNVSAAQIWHSDLVYDVAAILDETGLPPSLLCLELTESLLADSSGEGRVRNVLKDLCSLGVRLALDDFGTDYSSLGYLAQLPFHRLKIDRIFVSGAATSVRSKELLKGMVALGRGLNMEVVGEGAENQAELSLLKEIGCNIVQGFVHSQAVCADEAIAFTHRHEGTLSTENRRPAKSFGTKKSEYLSSRMGSQ